MPTRKAFVVDNYREQRDALVLAAHALGWEATPFASATQCFKASIYERPDCILTDLHMPVMTGADLAERLRAEGLEIPIIAITGAPPGSELMQRALAAGVKQVLRKPYRLEDLRNALAPMQ